MILFDMDYPTIYRQMFSESDKIEYYLRKNLTKVTSLKQGRYIAPHYFYDIIKMPKSNNTYMLYWNIPDFEAFYYDDYKIREKNVCCGAILLVQDKKGRQHGITYKRYKVQVKDTFGLVDGLYIFSPHFFSRYRERFEIPQEVKSNDNLAAFAARNLNYFFYLDYNEMVLEKDRQENGVAIAVKDGIILGDMESMTVDGKPLTVTRARTFLKDNNLKDDQAELNPTKEDVLEAAKQMFKRYKGYEL